MEIRVYQTNDREIAFSSYGAIVNLVGHVPGDRYAMVCEGKIQTDLLDGVYMALNADDRPNAATMRSLSVSDVVEILESEHYDSGTFWFCDNSGWICETKHDSEGKMVGNLKYRG